MMSYFSGDIYLAFLAYLVGTASPGPSNLAIMGTAMAQGRIHALVLAAGVVSGSLIWGFSAAFGLSALMQTYSWSLIAMKILGGTYMLWLALKAAREALSSKPGPTPAGIESARLRNSYLRGLGMHLTNPKAIFVWLSIVTLGLPQKTQGTEAFFVVTGCGIIGIVVFSGYALTFSTKRARQLYHRSRRWFNATFAAVFAYAGVRILLTKTSPA